MALPNTNTTGLAVKRVRLCYALLLCVVAVFGIRLFYIQVIRYDHYKHAALSDQLKQYEIPATRGVIEVHDGDGAVPIVLNQKLYTLYADPVYIKDANKAAEAVAGVVGGHASDYLGGLTTKSTRYVVLAKKLSQDQNGKILALKYPGLGTQEQDYRTYPQGELAAQLLGFVNDGGVGTYGLEQALNKELTGTAGQLKAITDVNGIPLAASPNNVEVTAKPGANLLLTLDLGMQAQMEKILQQEYQKTKSKGLSAVIIDPNSGQVKAMANYPTYDPSQYSSVNDPGIFQNAVATNAIEPGSTMKLLTTAAALDQKVISPDTTFYDPAHWVVDGFNITDIEEDGGARTQSIGSLLNLSLNTGATWELMQMGGGQINTKARNTWYDYMNNHFLLGHQTGVEQGYEATGYIPSPRDNGAGIDLTYANSSFGQGVTVTALQMAAAVSAILNGGTYYQPYLVDQATDSAGRSTVTKPKVLKTGVVSPQVSQGMESLMEYVVQQHYQSGFSYLNFSPDYMVGGKTGTAQIANPAGGYYGDKYNGTYIGFVGGNKVQYVVVVFNIQPGVAGYAGSYGGQPVFGDLAHMLIDGGYVMPKSQ
ncbi:MAG TPA: penicillin-binding protein 2 [Patescibacteria group bacterium]|nr:penicillin-binding protein 2 [Patescibacteria group bacterium]